MWDRFGFKDYLNYIFSGFLWIIVFILGYQTIGELFENFPINRFRFVNINNTLLVLFILFASYIIGNIFRSTDKLVNYIMIRIWGDLYQQALYHDREKLINNKETGDLGILTKNKRNTSLGKKISKQIQQKIDMLDIQNISKKNQLIMAETFLNNYCLNKKYIRLKDMANLYESIILPIVFICILVTIRKYINFPRLEYILFEIAVTIMILIFLFTRYKYLKLNYIKEVYRNIFVVFKENSDKKVKS